MHLINPVIIVRIFFKFEACLFCPVVIMDGFYSRVLIYKYFELYDVFAAN